MGKKILVAFDDSENAMRAVEFVSRAFRPDYEVTLFSVILDTMDICEMHSPGLTPLFLSHPGNPNQIGGGRWLEIRVGAPLARY